MKSQGKSRRRRVLVIHKKTNYQRLVRERGSERVRDLLDQADESVAHMRSADEDHEATLAHTREFLATLGVEATFCSVDDAIHADGVDLVVTLGGDGALLAASHGLGAKTPALAINTAPRTSVGYFCAADSSNLEDVLRSALQDELSVTHLSRMAVELAGTTVSERVLNDVLFSAASPAETTRYVLRHGAIEEDQKSSGVWVGPAAGSTAAQRSAGGKVMPIGSRRLQFVVREAYWGDRAPYQLTKGFVESGDALEIRNKTPDARLWLDGPYREVAVPLGANVVLRRSNQSLRLLGHRDKALSEPVEP